MFRLGHSTLRHFANNPGLAIRQVRLHRSLARSATQAIRRPTKYGPVIPARAGLHIKDRTVEMHPEADLEDTIERSLSCNLNTNEDDDAPAPLGHISIAFTDIKNSTAMWEISTSAMLTALETH